EAVGRLQRDGADHAVTYVLGDLEGEDPLLAEQLEVDLELVVHLGHGVDGELHVDDRPDHAGDATGTPGLLVLLVLFDGGSHFSHSLPAWASASAFTPPTISLISWVIPA